MKYHYKMCGLDYVYLLNGFIRHETAYGSGTSIEQAENLDCAIAATIIATPFRFRGQEVRFLRSLLNLSQMELAIRLGVKRITVARWEGARTTPIPGPSDRLLRIIAAHSLFEMEYVEGIIEILSEISDSSPEEMHMHLVKHDELNEPSLFPANKAEEERWKPSRAA